VKERDDLMAATRYGIMSLRYAECLPRRRREQFVYRTAGSWMAG
jgi:hypothetical protein